MIENLNLQLLAEAEENAAAEEASADGGKVRAAQSRRHCEYYGDHDYANGGTVRGGVKAKTNVISQIKSARVLLGHPDGINS